MERTFRYAPYFYFKKFCRNSYKAKSSAGMRIKICRILLPCIGQAKYAILILMNTTMKRKKRSSHKGTLKPVMVFLLTLGGITLAGLCVLLAVSGFQKADADVKNKYESVQSSIFQERIPVSQTDSSNGGEAEVTSELLEENPRYGKILADEEYMAQNRIYPWEASSTDEVTLCFTGDILMDDEYAIMSRLKSRGGSLDEGISEDLIRVLRQSDITVVNNEFPYTNRGTPTEGKTFTFRADTDAVSYLEDMGADVAIVANNHTYDFGEQGLLDTLDTLEQASIHALGAGRNIKEASAPVYFIVNDMKIAMIAATQIERLDNPDTKEATETSPGVFRCWNPEKLCEVIAQAKAESDFVIVCVHWGTENESNPDWAQTDQAPLYAQAGADLIVGDHPHCLQGVTYCGNTPVLYSLGNFWFNSKTLDTGLLKVSIGQDEMKSLQFIPAIQSDCRVKMVYDSEKERILSYLRSLSPGVQIDSDGYISQNGS